MIIKKNIFVLIVMLFLASLSAYAQNRNLRFADDKFKYERFGFAADEYEKAYSKKEKYSTALLLAESYQNIHDYENSFKWWNEVIQFEESTKEDFYQFLIAGMKLDPEFQLEDVLAQSQFNENDFPELDLEYIKYLYSKRSNLKLIPFDSVNSNGSDYGIVQGLGNTMYFASDRGGVIPSEKKAIRLDAKNQFQTKEKYNFNDRQFFLIYSKDSSDHLNGFDVPSDEVFHFSDPFFVKEKNILFYTITRGINKVKRKREITVYPELYYSTLSLQEELLDPKAFPFNDSLNYGVISPFIDLENKRLYFSSNMEGGYGGYDIYYSSFDDSLNFESPINLGPVINSPGNERDPFLYIDKLYFSSDGHKGLGGFDVFVSEKTENGFESVENLGIPYNSPNDDFSFRKYGEQEIFISSDRMGGKGMDDIYYIESLYKYLITNVIDCQDVGVDGYSLEVFDDTNRKLLESQVLANNKRLTNLEPNSDFQVSVSKEGFFSISDNTITTKNIQEDTLYRNYKLIPIPYQLGVYVDIVYYDLDKFNIRSDAQQALDQLGELMNKYDFLDLVVSSHTDSRASDEYNIVLSNNRANAVRDYLSKWDISPSRIRLEWFGEKVLTNNCVDGIDCPEFEHQLNRRSELVLELFPDPTVQYSIPNQFKEFDICNPSSIQKWFFDQVYQLPTIYFDFDKSMLRSIHKKELERVALMLKTMPKLNLAINGYTDQFGTDKYNLDLSMRRSESVKKYLLSKEIEAFRLYEYSFGETSPVYDCGLMDCNHFNHQKNRRVELKINF
ncbi:OmpA family protein [Algoriphagus limi]|uniref:OmpA family protein n=1 Tax=Algoriphagus limi TaxID=2975273 RepID=A0ABT2G7F8_9BACT|nr:OmpA family protein [Algoriphagus limi]MCS5491199.1 OmpA family protein [Algoriphagus limi]